MSPAITQLSCFSSIINNRRLHLNNRSYPRHTSFRPGKVLNLTSGDGRGVEVSSLENKTTPSYVEDASISQNGNSVKSHSFTEGGVGESNGHIEEQVVSQPKKAAKIHDFCLGIPFGGLVLSGGLVGFVFSRNPVTLSSGVLFGGALLALSTFSMKVWRQGKSSSPFILGQAVLSVALLWKNFQAYALTKKLFPSGCNAVISAAMLCFYAYVVISGGNPPPKKLKSPAIVE
ncbi:hypothetical protein BUALT_Bualt12G0023300 [Buddleja alternifolia]|uniref:Protein FATTY ACID EXPORT 1, chloroplastic n=1 Tax=Buddleja alternifolia TaxID=168488 RepID=A0AAV6WSX8_9LAMI|nr:hypothetical protein BUALT_Bualt12G0023300 [Buddleja alternifolia]